MPEHGSRTSESHALFESDPEYGDLVQPELDPFIAAAVNQPALAPGSDAHGLLRILLHYAVQNRSSRAAAAWATLIGLVDHLSYVYLLELLELNAPWLAELAKAIIAGGRQRLGLQPLIQGRGVVAVDGSWVNSAQADKGERGELVHLCFELATGWIRQFHLPLEQRDGESLTHFQFDPDSIVLADRLYCNATSVKHVVECGADVLVRWRRNCHLYPASCGRPGLDWRGLLDSLEPGQRLERVVWLQRRDGQRVAVRWVAQNMGDEFAEQELEKARASNRTITDELKRYAGFLVVVTTLGDEFDTEQLIELYHQRWSAAEISIRRLKTRLGFKHVVGKDARKRRAWLYCQLLFRGLLQLLDAESVADGEVAQLALTSADDDDDDDARQLHVRVDIEHDFYRLLLLKAALLDALMPMRLSWWSQIAPRLAEVLPRPRRGKRSSSINMLVKKLVPPEVYDAWCALT